MLLNAEGAAAGGFAVLIVEVLCHVLLIVLYCIVCTLFVV